MSLYIDIFLFVLFILEGVGMFYLFKRISSLKRQHESLISELTRQVEANQTLKSKVSAFESEIQALKKKPIPPRPKVEQQKKAEKTAVKTTVDVAPKAKNETQKNLWHDVVFLARQGLTADKIARDLNITRGEVELILGLHNFKPRENDN